MTSRKVQKAKSRTSVAQSAPGPGSGKARVSREGPDRGSVASSTAKRNVPASKLRKPSPPVSGKAQSKPNSVAKRAPAKPNGRLGAGAGQKANGPDVACRSMGRDTGGANGDAYAIVSANGSAGISEADPAREARRGINSKAVVTAKRGAAVSNRVDDRERGGTATKAQRRAAAEDAAVTSISVSSRSGGEKVKGVDTIKKSAKSGEAGASVSTLPAGYRPTDGEPFMNERQRLYFRNKLIAWKEEIVRQNRETLQGLHEDSAQHADVADRATFETDRALELRARDRQRKLIAKIDSALARIEEGTYGYCEETGEPISLKRLDARPIATLSIEAQERHERRERVFREE